MNVSERLTHQRHRDVPVVFRLKEEEMADTIEFVPVPPPKVTPVDPVAFELGLLPGLRARKHDQSFRCSGCHKLRSGWLVWVPDGVRRGDDPAEVSEMCRLNARNGHSSAWCLDCSQRLSGGQDPLNEVAVVLGVAAAIVAGGLALLALLA